MKRYVAAAVAILVGLGAVLLAGRGEDAMDSGSPGPALPRGAREATVVRVVDGDTVELGGGLGKSRLIGIDTPEVYGGVECYGREASAYAKRQLEGR
ncbi:MAG TPA: hypothetical protein VGV10_07185, partial [Thermoleophilaceae bacterium]|nr:hypothetical protein [Thermoleophilaceae bacterium]